MMDRFKQRLGKTSSVQSINTNIKTNINFVSEYKELPYNEISELVNAYDVFSDERSASDKYRLFGTIRLVASNSLPDITGQDSLSILDSTNFRNFDPFENIQDVTDVEDYTFKESYAKYFKEIDGWYSYVNPSLTAVSKCSKIDFSPKRTSFEIVNTNKNWHFCITYPYANDTGHTLVNGGLLVVDTETAIIASVQKTLLITAVKHNLVAGDKVRITGTPYSGDYSVRRVGRDNGQLRDYAFVIDLLPASIIVGSTIEVRIKKVYFGEESIYYFRKFSAITEVDDYELYNLAYSINIYGDKISQIVFNGGSGDSIDLHIGQLKDNLGRPLSELYLTTIKGKSYNNGEFSVIKSGIDIPFIGGVENFLNVPDIRRIHNVSSYSVETHTPIENNIQHTDTVFYGDIVEYNRLYLKEIVLGEINYRFNTNNRDSVGIVNLPNTGSLQMGPRPEGYMYKPHQRIKIREFSTYIENGDSSTDNIPDYATQISAGKYIWRDLLSLGFNDGSADSALDYPFINGSHYIHTNIFLNVRRQDPFNQYGLYYSTFPRDPYGDRLDTNNIQENSGDYVC